MRWLSWLFGTRLTPEDARKAFDEQRPGLAQAFLAAAAATGKPRGLRWKSLDWEPALELCRDRASGEMVALAGVTLAFEAIEGGEMEGVAAVSNLRNATALFVHRGGRWLPTGKALFNVNPDEALARFAGQLERLTGDQGPASQELPSGP
jgi:hypothetical protein